MKTNVLMCLSKYDAVSASYNLLSSILTCILKLIFSGILLLCTNYNYLAAQDIRLQNPSIEGLPGTGILPAPWIPCGNSPDTHPTKSGFCGIVLPPSDGKTYAGGLSGPEMEEGIMQKLETPIKKDKIYTLSFDLAAAAYYCVNLYGGSVAIYGSNRTTEKGELLWKSGVFYHQNWKRYTASILSSKDYSYISFWTYQEVGAANKYFAMLIDNFSPVIAEVPQVEVVVQNTCKEFTTGKASVMVKGGSAPYSYSWTPGGYVTDNISSLPSGNYEVVVTTAGGAKVSKKMIIVESEVEAMPIITPPSCNGLRDGQLHLQVSQGNAPYYCSLDNGQTFHEIPFLNVKAGGYELTIKDNRGCQLKIDNLIVPQPQPLQITSIYTQPVSCSETQDGKIALDVRGGTAPYSYSLDFHSWQGDSSWNQLDAGRYYFQIKDNNGCKVTGATEVTKNWRDCAVLVPTAFSPNGDGLNDIFRAKVHDSVRDFKLIVYNRWGQQVFQSNDPAQGWDGGQQTTGSYLWVLMYIDSKNQARKQQGNLTLIK